WAKPGSNPRPGLPVFATARSSAPPGGPRAPRPPNRAPRPRRPPADHTPRRTPSWEEAATMNIGDLPRMNAGRAPRKVALTDARGTTTYADLEARANALANGLLGLGVQPGSNVAVLMNNRAEHVETLFALAKLGTPGVPMDPKWRSREIAAAFGFFDVAAVVADASVAQELGRALGELPDFGGPVVWVGEPLPAGVARSHAYESLIAGAPTVAPDVVVHPDD